MMKATISGQKRIAEGGCNACTAFALNVYHLTFSDGTCVSLERLDVPTIVMAFAQQQRWQQAFTMLDMTEEAMLYQKAGETVTEQDDSATVSYQKGCERLKVAKEYCELADLYQNVNHVLTRFFNMEEVDFDYEVIEREPVI